MGAGVTYTAYFKSAGKTSGFNQASIQELETARKKMADQDYKIAGQDKVISDLVDRLAKLESKVGENERSSEGLGSCSVKNPLVDDEENKGLNLAADYSLKSPIPSEQIKVVNLDESTISAV